ncbi:MAG TPA: FdhF/YdeP family oxidoreductase, partial [Nitrolancea sp.]|nr:FdhF/YdeP family oxidoreductase [Nitrolancea sp.]
MGVERAAKTLLAMNQKDGFDCMSCAWPDPDNRKIAEFCENGARAVTWEATPITVPTTFWAEHSITDLLTKSEYWLGMQGRLVEPVYKAADSDNYVPVSWSDALTIIAEKLRGLESPDQAAFYTSGRTANETAFVYQLFARAYGTNNLPDCSNMCHESTGTAMGETVGIGKSTIAYDDFEETDLVIVMGQNPGTNHPRMLTALEDAKRNGAKIVAVNPLPEAGLLRYKNPQTVRGLIGRGTEMADQFLQIRLGGDMALLQAVSKRVLEAEDRNPGTVLDHEFLDQYTQGLDGFRAHLSSLDDAEVGEATGLRPAEIDELADRYIAAKRVIITWAMGITQHRKGVDTIKEIVNLLLLRGNIGRPGAGASPIRGHSNVQGDRTMGIWEKMPDKFLDALAAEFHFEPPREHGFDSVKSIQAMQRNEIKVWFALGGNLVAAISDTGAAEAAMHGTDMTIQVSTKLNRSHAVVGAEALILPTMGRTEFDMQETGPQFLSVEDTVCAVHATHGAVPPVSPNLLSEVAIVTRLARAVFGDDGPIDWAGFERDYDRIRESISRVVPGFETFNEQVRRKGGFVLPNGPRDSRTFPTASGKAMITVNELEAVVRPAGRLILQTMRSHDQFNTT